MGNISLFIGGVQNGFLPASIMSEIDPRAMTDVQLVQVITETSDLKRIKAHIHEYSQRHDLPLDWFADDTRNYVITGIEPPKTPTGLWVRSVLREQRKVLSLTEYKDYALGYIALPTGVTTAMACDRVRGLITASVGDVVYRWSDKAVWNFLRDRTEPQRTNTHVLIEDKIRDKLDYTGWRDIELVELFKGNVLPVQPNTLDLGITEARRRFTLPAAWSDAEVMDYVIDSVIPPKTGEGDWVHDITRLEKPFPQWTDSELVSLVRGEIDLPTGKTMEHAFREMRERWYYKDDATAADITKDIQELGIDIATRPVEFLQYELQNFVDVMTNADSKRIDKAIVHTQLNNAIRRTYRMPLERFMSAWTIVLDFAQLHDNVFSGKNVFEAANFANLTNRTMEVYMQSLVLIVNTCHVKDRYSLVRGEFTLLFQLLRDGVIEGKIATYYKV